MRLTILCLAICFLISNQSAHADDWPQWLGPKRQSVWKEQGIVKRFPKEGLNVKWRVPVGLGYSGPAVVKGKVYLTDYKKKSGNVTNGAGTRDKLQGSERILCFSADTGEILWKHEYERSYSLSYPSGPRCTPTVADGKVYALGAEGNLVCLDADKGTEIWSRDLVREYKTETPIWGFAAHPLVDGNTLYCVVGGKGSIAVAFDKNTGQEKWRALSASATGYCPPTIIEHAGTKQLLIWHPDALNSLDPNSGKLHWSVPLKPSYEMSIAVPRKLGDHLFASGIGSVSALIKLDNTKPAAKVLWRGNAKSSLYAINSTPFFEDGVIYGINGRTGSLIASRMTDGKRLWESFQPISKQKRSTGQGTAFLVKHEDRFFLFNDSGDLILANLSPEGYKELGRFHVLEPTNTTGRRSVVWSHPAFAEKSLFARNDKELVRVSLAENK